VLKKFLQENKLIILAGLAFVVSELFYVLVIPLWQNHDELEHYAYTHYLVEQRALPPYRTDLKTHWELVVAPEIQTANQLLESDRISFGVWQRNQLIHQDFSVAKANKQAIADIDPVDRKIDSQDYKNATTSYSPFYYLLESLPYGLFYQGDIISRATAMRIFNIFIALLTVIFAYKSARLIFKDKLASVTCAILIGFIPAFANSSAGLNNDSLITAAGTIFIFLLLAYLPQKLSPLKSLWLGLVFGLGLLTKPQFAIFALPLLAFYIFKFFKDKNYTSWIISVLIIVLCVAVLFGPWFFYIAKDHNALEVTGISMLTKQVSDLSLIEAIKYITLRYIFLYYSFFFAAGCCHEISVAPFFQGIFGLGLGLAFLGFIWYLVNFRKETATADRPAIGLLILTPLAMEVAYLAIYLRQALAGGTIDFPIDGRYLYPVISALAVLFVLVLKKITPPRFLKIVLVCLCFLAISINYFNLLFNIIPRYYL
jgi:4-amino-4-deoxy-L-arabinose transferase-like glycosyltransferase